MKKYKEVRAMTQEKRIEMLEKIYTVPEAKEQILAVWKGSVYSAKPMTIEDIDELIMIIYNRFCRF